LRFFGLILENIFMVFWGSSCSDKKRDKKNRWKKTTGNLFFMDFPQICVCGVFELPLLRNAQKRHKRKLIKLNKKTTIDIPTYPI
jgi:hypothetical protein